MDNPDIFHDRRSPTYTQAVHLSKQTNIVFRK